jgi:hypothetical protein
VKRVIPTFIKPHHEKGDLRIGWASWDEGTFECRSIKWAYHDASGKISRGSPEIPFNVLVDMVLLAHEQGELSTKDTRRLRKAFGTG